MTMQEMISDIDPDLVVDQEPEIEPGPAEVEADPYEDEAQQYGWKPAGDWAGDGHMSAEKFMTRGPGTSRKLEATVTNLTKEIEDWKGRTTRNEKAITAAADARVAAAEDRIRAEMREAVEGGDTAKFDALEKERDEIRSAPASSGPPQADQDAVKSWVVDNPKFNKDPEFKAVAMAAWQSAESAGVTSVPEILKRIDSRMAALYPPESATPKPQVRKAAAVDPGGTAPQRKRGKGWSDIPAADRSMAEDFISDGTFDDLAKANKTTPQEAYAESYWSQDQ
jgi:hypothetical protein